MMNVFSKFRRCKLHTLPGNFLFLPLCLRSQYQLHVSSCYLNASEGVTGTDVDPDVEICFDNNEGTSSILVVRPFTDKDKIEACQTLNLVKKNSKRHVFMPYEYDFQCLDIPEVTYDCGANGDCFYRYTNFYSHLQFLFCCGLKVLRLCLCFRILDALVTFWRMMKHSMDSSDRRSMNSSKQAGLNVCHPSISLLSGGCLWTATPLMEEKPFLAWHLP